MHRGPAARVSGHDQDQYWSDGGLCSTHFVFFGIPYLFRDSEHFWKVALGPIGKELLVAGENKGLRGLCYYDAGARSFYAKEAINTPADLVGKKIRVMNSVMAMDHDQGHGRFTDPHFLGRTLHVTRPGAWSMRPRITRRPSTPRVTSRSVSTTAWTKHVRLPDMLVISAKVWADLSDQQQAMATTGRGRVRDLRSGNFGPRPSKSHWRWSRPEGVEVIYPGQEALPRGGQAHVGSFSSMRTTKRDRAIGQLIQQIQEVQ